MKNRYNSRAHMRAKKAIAILRIVVLLVIMFALPLYLILYQKEWLEHFSTLANVKDFFKEYGAGSVLVYIGAQITQIVICVIPGQWLQIAAGFLFNFWMAILYSLIGAMVGTVLTYYIAKLLGRKSIHILFGDEKVNEFMDHLNSKKALVIVFLIYLIPGLPKDFCNYAAGLSNMKLKPFLIVSLVGRTPGMVGSLMIGNLIGKEGYIGIIIIAVISILLFAVGVIMRKKLVVLSDRIYTRLVNM